jgi:putative SOS response-associated peptidase YedK
MVVREDGTMKTLFAVAVCFGDPIETCTIVTTHANEMLQHVHDRMPVILAPGDYDRWLDADEQNPADLIRPFTPDALVAYPVSPRVNSPKNDDAPLIEQLPTGIIRGF